MSPKDIVAGPYNVSFNDQGTGPITVEERSAQVHKKGLEEYGTIVVLGGENYVKMISQVFSSKKISAPLSGCRGIGYMMNKLRNAIESDTPLP